MNVNLNKKSVKQQGGPTMEASHQMPDGSIMPGATHGESPQQSQPQVDPAIQQVGQMFASAVQDGGKPEEVVMSLLEQEVDENIIVQALMMIGYDETGLQELFQTVQELSQPQPATGSEVTRDPQELARNEAIASEQEGLNVAVDEIEVAKSGIEIKPENKGKFTAWAKARGMSVKEAYTKVMANTDAYPPAIVKMANFAKNAAGFKKQEGGNISYTEKIRQKEGTSNEAMTKMLDPRFKKGGAYEPHFMYKGDRKIRAKDNATHLRLKAAGYGHKEEVPKAQPGAEILFQGDQGIVKDELFFKPGLNPKGFDLGNAGNALLKGIKNFSGLNYKDNAIKNKIDYATNANYSYEAPEASLENAGAMSEFLARVKRDKGLNDDFSNLNFSSGINKSNEVGQLANDVKDFYNDEINPVFQDISDKVTPIINNIGEGVEDGVESISDYVKKLKQKTEDFDFTQITDFFKPIEKKSELEEQRFGGGLSKAQGGGPLDFQSWVMEDQVRRSTAQGPAQYQEYVTNFQIADADTNFPNGITPGESTMQELYDNMDLGQFTREGNSDGLAGTYRRFMNSNAVNTLGAVGDTAFNFASVFNDYYDQQENNEIYADNRASVVADNLMPTYTDPFLSEGINDINRPDYMGNEADRVTGLFRTAKKGGGINNAGFKALPPEAQYNIMSNMAMGGDPNPGITALRKVAPQVVSNMGYREGGETVNVDSSLLAKLIAAGADIEIL